ncbi:MAG TPA: 2-C-methyl-D-erythritol 4-phosphate cytidylyltransferase [Acidiferrobacteraceae bacterium]|nr:2-C-methyl-D-erythritol 4-phosphate cytidylyltransferase [Acidiferrobacteraceae bacterium]
MSEKPCWVIVPAAGVGLRMGTGRPKQYLDLLGKTVIQHSLERVSAHSAVKGVVVCVAKDDRCWPKIQGRITKLLGTASGGPERTNTVLNGLHFLRKWAGDEDWVLVHDGVRPCLRPEDVRKLIESVKAVDQQGGILGAPVADTLKRVKDYTIEETVPREGLWRALTPQLFRLGMLAHALESAHQEGVLVTDEASAMERMGHRPLMVQGSSDNIKITRSDDLMLAADILKRQLET